MARAQRIVTILGALPSVLEGGAFDFSSTTSFNHFDISRCFPFPILVSRRAIKFTNSRLFNALRLRSNDMKKVIDKQCTFVLFSRVFPNQNPRLVISSQFSSTVAPSTNHCPQIASHHPLKLFRINTCKSLSKQRTLTLFRLIDLQKTGGRGVLWLTNFLPPARRGGPPMSQRAYNCPLLPIASTLFHFPYPISPFLATLTKTAGCVPTLPILKLAPPPASSPIGFPSSHPLESPRRFTKRACTHRNEARA